MTVQQLFTQPVSTAMNTGANKQHAVSGEFITLDGERFYAIHNSDGMAPFFISVVSSSDHWLFVSSTGGLSAGRVSPETALFPYVTVDRIHESTPHTGCKTLFKVEKDGQQILWEPFNREHDGRFRLSRHIYKNTLGSKLCFEEVNHDLQLTFRYTWATSEQYGFVRQCELKNQAFSEVKVELLDGLQNILPAGTPRFTQTQSSNLVDAYKWNELDSATGLGMYSLYSAITDRAEPCESLRANTVFCLGLPDPITLLSNDQVSQFRQDSLIQSEIYKRGVRGAYLVNSALQLGPHGSTSWQFVANLEQDQKQITELLVKLRNPAGLTAEITDSVNAGSDALARIMGAADGFQLTNEENVSVHHYANVLFNVLRGGIFDDQYWVSVEDFGQTLATFNQPVYARHKEMLEALPDKLPFAQLTQHVINADDIQLQRLMMEYLPITFGRRHGDPSRPWNQFAIKVKDTDGGPLLSYQGNWRDIFQNWEALLLSYPTFVESVIAKFVNASTVDGYNPYRITKEGIDWEVEDPEDPWSYIGYWGDHQIIYLLKLLEQSRDFHPGKLNQLLRTPLFSYANVPYRLKPLAETFKDAKDTVLYDEQVAAEIEVRQQELGSDAKLLLTPDGEVYQVNLLEKLLVPLLSKISNLVIDGGIWLNTQRPEWNDANNALVGQGVSMVTLYYLRRYIAFMQALLAQESLDAKLSAEVCTWLKDTLSTLQTYRGQLQPGKTPDALRFELLQSLGQSASDYRQTVYQQGGFSGIEAFEIQHVNELLDHALAFIDHSIATNQRQDGMYHAYNLLALGQQEAAVDHLYPMLEGQVAALSSGAIAPQDAIVVLESLFASEVYRQDQHTFMLYPDRPMSSFLNRNKLNPAEVEANPVLMAMLKDQQESLVMQDTNGDYRFHADITNVAALRERATELLPQYPALQSSLKDIETLYETVFNHQAFTGRSGGMFGFEGLGCIYWHMVSKLLLAVMETFYRALDQQADHDVIQRLGELYYQVRFGIGFNKSPADYGAFPTDPYSHTPGHAGAQQPGMTGQVKEEIVSRAGELGVRVQEGTIRFQPKLLRKREFTGETQGFRYLDVHNIWQEISVPESGLAFTWCQVPVVYQLNDQIEPSLTVHFIDESQQSFSDLVLSESLSKNLFERSGKITRITLILPQSELLGE